MEHFEQPAERLFAAFACRLKESCERGVGLDGHRLRGQHRRQVRAHFLLGDADRVRPVVQPQPGGVDFVEQVAGFLGVQALLQQRAVADAEADEPVEVRGFLAGRGAGQAPEVGDRAEAQLGERAVRFGRGVAVAVDLIHDAEVPVDDRQFARVALHHPGAAQRDPAAIAAFAVKAPHLRADAVVIGEDRHLAVGGQRRQAALRRAGDELSPPLLEQPRGGDDQRPKALGAGGAVVDRAAGGDRLAGRGLAHVEPGADDLQSGGEPLRVLEHRVVVERSDGGHPHELPRAGVEDRVRSAHLQFAQQRERLVGDDAAGDRGEAV